MRYNFLVLSLLFLVPGGVICWLRRDLRSVAGVMALCAIPFAFTEFLFYPSYWEPVFLFDLADRLGFGLEDLLFVIGLAAFTSTVYAFVSGRRYQALEEITGVHVVKRVLLILVGVFLQVTIAAAAGVAMIYGSFVIMLVTAGALCLNRRDLFLPGVLGGGMSLLVYTVLCWLFSWWFPGVFELTWHLEQFSNVFLLGIPLEELMYGFAAGFAATVFYPFITGKRLIAWQGAYGEYDKGADG